MSFFSSNNCTHVNQVHEAVGASTAGLPIRAHSADPASDWTEELLQVRAPNVNSATYWIVPNVNSSTYWTARFAVLWCFVSHSFRLFLALHMAMISIKRYEIICV